MKIFALSRHFSSLLLNIFHSNRFSTKVKINEVGKLLPTKVSGQYETGQLFIHRLFGYRGVILIPWIAQVFNRDLEQNEAKDNQPNKESYREEEKGEMHDYYQVLVDSRDSPHITSQLDSITFIGFDDSKPILSYISGLDYVPFEDIAPYTSTEIMPLDHDLFKQFLSHSPGRDPPFEARESLKVWQRKNRAWLQLTGVYKETTEDVRVTVIPFYMGWRETTSSYWWRYCVRLENLGKHSVQLRERNWKIFSIVGALETVKGRGVVGQEPKLTVKHPAFQYCSHISLPSSIGHVWGTFRMEREDGHIFDCKIPTFSLESRDNDFFEI